MESSCSCFGEWLELKPRNSVEFDRIAQAHAFERVRQMVPSGVPARAYSRCAIPAQVAKHGLDARTVMALLLFPRHEKLGTRLNLLEAISFFKSRATTVKLTVHIKPR
jgi:hypothetical protein